MPLYILGIIVVIGALFLILTSKRPSRAKKKIVIAPFKVNEKEQRRDNSAESADTGTATSGKVIHLYRNDEESDDS